jgi:hypothetical protein
MNDRSFEDRKRMLEELVSFFFYTLYLWTTAFVAHFLLNFHDFLVFISPSS